MPLILATLSRFWPLIAGGVALLVVGIVADHRGYNRGFHKRDAEVAAYEKTISDVRIMTAQATADAQAHARQVETAQDAITRKQTDALEDQLSDARASAAAYAKRLRTQAGAAESHCRQGSSAQVSDTSVSPTETGGATLLDEDIRICSEGVVKAQAWKDWYLEQAKIDR